MTETTDPQAAVEERVARHLAAKDWLTTSDRWDQATASFRADYLAYAREVIALVQPASAPAAPAAAPSAPADRAAIRAAALREAEGALRAQAKHMAGEFNDSDVLHEDGPAATVATWKRAADLLRLMAAEAQQPETQADDEPPCTCAAAGDCFAPAGHYADCPAAVSQPGKEAEVGSELAALLNACPAAHGALGRICELPKGHTGMHTGSGPNGGAVWEGDASA